jgi:hypothetical protein
MALTKGVLADFTEGKKNEEPRLRHPGLFL